MNKYMITYVFNDPILRREGTRTIPLVELDKPIDSKFISELLERIKATKIFSSEVQVGVTYIFKYE